MNNRKNHNSILFLTTLGVYLGLVLVGASPVLGHAATTRNFEIQDEIEVKDDLDRKPDGDLFAAAIVKLVKDLERLSAGNNFSWNETTKLSIEDLGFCESDNSSSFLGFGSLNRDLQRSIEASAVDIGRRLFAKKAELKAGESYSGWPETMNFEFISGSDGLRLQIALNTTSGSSAQVFAASINEYLTRLASSPKIDGQKLVAENTKSKVDDTRVILVTHLPRAGLNPLLAKNAQ